MTSRCPERTKQWYKARFAREYDEAREEWLRLWQLLTDVYWFNFETHARSWRGPWRGSVLNSRVELNARIYEYKWRRGHRVETARFPIYYEGIVEDAPPLPPEIALGELREAHAYMLYCQKQKDAPDDWAPGGALYSALCETTRVGKSSNPEQESDVC